MRTYFLSLSGSLPELLVGLLLTISCPSPCFLCVWLRCREIVHTLDFERSDCGSIIWVWELVHEAIRVNMLFLIEMFY